jgi:hypothetical protein
MPAKLSSADRFRNIASIDLSRDKNNKNKYGKTIRGSAHDPDVETLRSAKNMDGSFPLRRGSAGVGAAADRRAAQRHSLGVPLRLYGALLQRAAGWSGVVAMPAEKHVQPRTVLPERGECGGETIRAGGIV